MTDSAPLQMLRRGLVLDLSIAGGLGTTFGYLCELSIRIILPGETALLTPNQGGTVSTCLELEPAMSFTPSWKTREQRMLVSNKSFQHVTVAGDFCASRQA